VCDALRGGVKPEQLVLELAALEQGVRFVVAARVHAGVAGGVVRVVGRKRRGRGIRGARRWSAEEDKALGTESGAGWKVSKMARVHRRSRMAVYVRLARLKRHFVSLRGGAGA
jgi:hypothetical protein